MKGTESKYEIIADTIAREVEEARRAGALGYMARAMVQATIPHRRVPGQVFKRRNGHFELRIVTPLDNGLPFGVIPRLLLAWVTTEAVRKKERTLTMGDSLSEFMEKLDLVPTGGRWGTITRLRDQSKRLFSAHISCEYEKDDEWALRNVPLIEDVMIWWRPKQPTQKSFWESKLTLTEPFFREVTYRPVPIDMRAIRALRRSPMAIDLYTWLTYRMSYLRASTVIPWEGLQLQFGAGYPMTEQGLRNFKKGFLRAAKDVLKVYPEARIGNDRDGLLIRPSRTHIPNVGA